MILAIRICSFNIQKFGRSSAEKKDLDAIAGIIREHNLDIVAIQEIANKEALKMLLEAISYQYAQVCENDVLLRGNKTISGYQSQRQSNRTSDCYGYRTKHWEGRWAKPGSAFGGNEAEGYAFIWNRDRIQLVTNRYGNVFEPRISERAGAKNLVRPPLIGKFMPINGQYEIRLINTHIMYAAPSKRLEDDAAEDAADTELKTAQSDYLLRRAEFDCLVRDVYRNFQREIKDPSGRDQSAKYRTPYTFLLGDYNLNMSSVGRSAAKLSPLQECIVSPSAEIVTVNRELTSIRQGPRDPEARARFNQDPRVEVHLANNYDHFTYDNKRLRDHNIGSPVVGIILAFDRFQSEATGEKTKYDIYRDKVSDHLPIFLEFDVRKRDMR